MSLRRLLLSVRVQGYNTRPDAFQSDMQSGLVTVLDDAAGRAKLRRTAWERERSGDGELSVLPLDESEDVVIGKFVRELNAELELYNRLKAADVRLRLRLALHFGPASQGANGFSGDGPVLVTLLSGCGPLRAALDQTDAALAVIMSKEVFTDTVKALRVPLDPKKMRQVRVREQGVEVDTWLWLPGRDAHALRLAGEEPDGPPDQSPGDTAGPGPSPPAHPGHTTTYFPNATFNNVGTVIGHDQIINNHWERP